MASHNMQAAESLLKETDSLISLPEVCMKLREVLSDPEHTREEVGKLIMCEPALTTRILKIVNSAFYSLPGQVKTINHALNIIGEEELNNLVIISAIVKAMNGVPTQLDIKKFWASSVFCAVFAENLAKKTYLFEGDSEEFFICGLLLNVGKLLLYCREPELFETVQDECLKNNRKDFEVETELLGFNHMDVGKLLAVKWNFPQRLANSIGTHHNYSAEAGPENPIMFFASLFSEHMLEDSAGVNLDEIDLEELKLVTSLNISSEDFNSVVNASQEEYKEIHDAFCGNTD